MTAAEAIDALRYHAHSQTCTLTPRQCAELVAALEWAVEAEREACARVVLDLRLPIAAEAIRARGAK